MNKIPRFIAVQHATEKLCGIADLQNGAVARYFIKVIRDVTLECLNGDHELLAATDSFIWLTPTKNWICEDRAFQYAYDDMLSRQPMRWVISGGRQWGDS